MVVNKEQILSGQLPDGKQQIPVFHYGLSGINDLGGMYQVIWSLYAYYYNPQTIKDQVWQKFDYDLKEANLISHNFKTLIGND